MTKLYEHNDCGLPTKYNPKISTVHYRTIEKIEDQIDRDEAWQLHVTPTKTRAPARKAEKADKPDSGKKQKVQHGQTTLTSHTVATSPKPARSALNDSVPIKETSTAIVHVPDEESPRADVSSEIPLATLATATTHEPMAQGPPPIAWTPHGKAFVAHVPDHLTYSVVNTNGTTLIIASPSAQRT